MIMNEHDWFTRNDPMAMLKYLTGKEKSDRQNAHKPFISDRKLRLFACACWEVSEIRQWMHKSLNASYSEIAMDGQPLEDASPGSLVHRPVAFAKAWSSEAEESFRKREANFLRDIAGNPFATVLPNHIRDWVSPTVRKIAQAIYENHTFEDMPILADALEENGCTNEVILHHCRGEFPNYPRRMKAYHSCPKCGNQGDWHGGPGQETKEKICLSGYHKQGVIWQPGQNYPPGPSWIPKPFACVRGCWVTDLLLGKQ